MNKDRPVIDLTALETDYQVIAYFESRRRALESPSLGVCVHFKMKQGNKRFGESLVLSEISAGNIKLWTKGEFALAC